MAEQKNFILILDDDDIIRRNLKLFLEDENFQAYESASGEDALRLIQEKDDIRLVIVDIRLPKMSGDEFMLKAYEFSPNLCFIVHTGSKNYKIPPVLLKRGFNEKDIFFKPIPDLNIIAKRIKDLLA